MLGIGAPIYWDGTMDLFDRVRHRRLLVSDFDGTITKVDFYERVLEAFPNAAGSQGWQKFLAGQVSHLEALQSIFEVLPNDESYVMTLARTTEIDPHFADAVRQLDEQGWSVLVASAGCQWYIDRLLTELAVNIPIISNPGDLEPAGGLRLRAPTDSPYFSADTGIDKGIIVREAMTKFERVAFAGNGRADLAAALMVDPKVRFATGWLADKLSAQGQPFHRFDSWSEIGSRLPQVAG